MAETKDMFLTRLALCGMTGVEVSRRAGISRNTLASYKRGLSVPRVDVAIRLARCLGCRVEDLWSAKLEVDDAF